MALILSCTLPSDIVLENAYHKITWYSGGAAGENAQIEFSIYKDHEAREANKSPATSKRISVPITTEDTGNIYQILYQAAKLHPDYEGASDQI